jgi:shikimate kinase
MTFSKSIFLVGMPGSGKSTLGRSLARHFDLEFVDTDHVMVTRTGVPVTTIFEIEGETGFREREAQLIEEFTQQKGIVLATGGGAILRESNRHALRDRGLVIYLRARLDDLVERTKRDNKRPLLQGKSPREALQTLLAARDPLYNQVAHLTVDSGRQSVARLTGHVIKRLQDTGLWTAHDLPASDSTPHAT